jgi:class 3 adenylate cyclase
VQQLAEGWARRGQELGFGVGIAQGYATLGRIGFEGRFDYAAIGSVVNLAARLCAEAKPWQLLVSQRVQAACDQVVVTELLGDLDLRGFADPVRAYNVRGLNAAIAP